MATKSKGARKKTGTKKAATTKSASKTRSKSKALEPPEDEPDDDSDEAEDFGDESATDKLSDWLNCGRETIFLDVDVDKLTVTQSGSVKTKQLAKFDTFDALCAGYPRIWQAIADEYGEGEVTDEAGNDAAPMDIQAAWLRKERRAGAKAGHDDGVWAGKLAKARELLAAFKGHKAAAAAVPARHRSKDLDFSGKALAKSLTYVIEVERDPAQLPYAARKSRSKKPSEAGARLPIGVSKIGGWPHLPPDLAWPEINGKPLFLFAQLSLAEIAAADPSGIVPARGMLYLFIAENAPSRVIYTEATNLELREPPTIGPDYMHGLVNNEQRLTFTPSYYFRQDTGDTYDSRVLIEALPATLLDKVGKALGCTTKPRGVFGDDRIFGGDPVDWQARYQSYLENELFAQLDYAEGHLSIGVDPDDLRIGCFDDADCGYCGT